MVLMLVHYIITDKVLKVNIYPIRFFAPQTLFVCLIAIITNIFLDKIIVRYAILSILVISMGGVLIKNKALVKNVINEIRNKKG